MSYKAYVKKNLDTSTVDVKVQYKSSLSDKFKGVNGKSFDCITGLWSFPLSEYTQITRILEDECDSVNTVKWFPTKEKTAKYIMLKD